MHWILPLWAAVHNDVLLHSHLIIERLLDPQIVVPRTGRSNLYHQHGDAAFVSQVERRLAKPVRDFIQHNDIRPKRSDSRYPPIYPTVTKDHHSGLRRKPRCERAVTVGKILRMPWFLHDEITLFGIEQVVACQGDFVNHGCPVRLGAAHIPPAIPKGIVGFCYPGPPGLRAYCLFHRYTPLTEKPQPAY